jgi:hypothetical protein
MRSSIENTQERLVVAERTSYTQVKKEGARRLKQIARVSLRPCNSAKRSQIESVSLERSLGQNG